MVYHMCNGKVFQEFVRARGIQHVCQALTTHRVRVQWSGALELNTNFDEEPPYLLFVLKDMPSESTGFTPYELVFVHDTLGPLHLVKQHLLDGEPKDFSLLE